LYNSLRGEDEVVESPSPVLGEFVRVAGTEGVKTMTGFLFTEFDTLWSFVEGEMNTAQKHAPKNSSRIEP
jgi:hypothetical protein